MTALYDLDKLDIPSRLFIVVRGLPSSGKSLIAKLLVGNSNGVAVSVDDFLTSPNGQYEFSKSNFIAAQEACRQYCRELMQAETELVVLHNTMSQAWEAKDYFDIANTYGYTIQIISLYDNGLNDTDLAKRSLHFMPAHLIQKCRQKWELDIYPHRQRAPLVDGVIGKTLHEPKIYLHSKKLN